MVWSANWTNGISADYYIPLADIFLPGEIPAVYGGATRVVFEHRELKLLRDRIISRWQATHERH